MVTRCRTRGTEAEGWNERRQLAALSAGMLIACAACLLQACGDEHPAQAPPPSAAHHDVLTEWSVDPRDPNRIEPASRREVLRIAHPSHDHVMGQIAFDPTVSSSDPDYGMSYIALGDGGNTWGDYKKVDALRTAQNKANRSERFCASILCVGGPTIHDSA
jgi:hypothetical protein